MAETEEIWAKIRISRVRRQKYGNSLFLVPHVAVAVLVCSIGHRTYFCLLENALECAVPSALEIECPRRPFAWLVGDKIPEGWTPIWKGRVCSSYRLGGVTLVNLQRRICRHVTLLNRFQKLPTRCSTSNIAKNRPQRGVYKLEWFFAQRRIIASWRCKLTSVTPPLGVKISGSGTPQGTKHQTVTFWCWHGTRVSGASEGNFCDKMKPLLQNVRSQFRMLPFLTRECEAMNELLWGPEPLGRSYVNSAQNRRALVSIYGKSPLISRFWYLWWIKSTWTPAGPNPRGHQNRWHTAGFTICASETIGSKFIFGLERCWPWKRRTLLTTGRTD